MKKPTTRLMIGSIVVCVLVLLATALAFAGEGFRHVEPATTLKQAGQDWQEGRLGASLSGYLHAYTMAIEAGARWAAARPVVDRMMAERKGGQLDRALASCSQAVDMLHGFDDEGSLSYECFALEAEIERQNELR